MIPGPANTVLIFGKDTAGLDVPIGVTAGVQATGTLTSDNTVAANGDTVTIGSTIYTFKTALSGADNEILIVAADADGTLLNLINAINGSGAKINGVDYLTKRQGGHPQVTAATSVAAHAFVVTAIDAGVAGNLIATTDTSGHLSWGATTLTGGTNAALSFSGSGTSTSPATGVVTVQNPSVTPITSAALEASKVIKASAGQLCSLAIFNSKASAQFILIMNSATVPADGAVTLLYPPIPIAAASLVVIDFPRPLVASTGIAVSNSSTGTFTKTIGSADCAFCAQIN